MRNVGKFNAPKNDTAIKPSDKNEAGCVANLDVILVIMVLLGRPALRSFEMMNGLMGKAVRRETGKLFIATRNALCHFI